MRKLLFILILSLSVIFLGACSAKSTSNQAADETEVALSQSTPVIIEPVSMEPQVDNCVECHTDKQMLIDTTTVVEEEAHGAESEGVG